MDTAKTNDFAVGIRCYFFLFCTSGLMSTGQRVFQALGMAKKAAFFAFFRKMVLMLLMLFLLPMIPGLGVNGIFMANNLSEAIAGIICYVTMRAVVRKKLQ